MYNCFEVAIAQSYIRLSCFDCDELATISRITNTSCAARSNCFRDNHRITFRRQKSSTFPSFMHYVHLFQVAINNSKSLDPLLSWSKPNALAAACPGLKRDQTIGRWPSTRHASGFPKNSGSNWLRFSSEINTEGATFRMLPDLLPNLNHQRAISCTESDRKTGQK